MTRPTAVQLARWALWACLGFNVALFAGDLAWGHSQQAAWQLIVVALIAGWVAAASKLDRRLDARVKEAEYRCEMSYRVLKEMERNLDAGHVRVDVYAQEDERKH